MGVSKFKDTAEKQYHVIFSESEAQDIVARWREANKRIRDLWYAMDAAAVKAVTEGGSVSVGRVWLSREYDRDSGLDCMTILLPSGRKLYYVNPALGTNQWGRPSVTYMGVEQNTKRWGRAETYGGRLVENVVQAIARDCLACAIERLEAAGYGIVMHVHDEVVVECPLERANLESVAGIMSQPMPWAPDLPLKADGWTSPYYKKE
jgi:DNA polymerase